MVGFTYGKLYVDKKSLGDTKNLKEVNILNIISDKKTGKRSNKIYHNLIIFHTYINQHNINLKDYSKDFKFYFRSSDKDDIIYIIWFMNPSKNYPLPEYYNNTLDWTYNHIDCYNLDQLYEKKSDLYPTPFNQTYNHILNFKCNNTGVRKNYLVKDENDLLYICKQYDIKQFLPNAPILYSKTTHDKINIIYLIDAPPKCRYQYPKHTKFLQTWTSYDIFKYNYLYKNKSDLVYPGIRAFIILHIKYKGRIYNILCKDARKYIKSCKFYNIDDDDIDNSEKYYVRTHEDPLYLTKIILINPFIGEGKLTTFDDFMDIKKADYNNNDNDDEDDYYDGYEGEGNNNYIVKVNKNINPYGYEGQKSE